MAKFTDMIPLILYHEESLNPKYFSLPPSEMLNVAKKKGVHFDADDPGGYTIAGITLATYKEWRKSRGFLNTTVNDLRNIPYYDWECILKERFWDRWKADHIKTPAIAYMLVDWVWTSGKYGITRVQKLLGVNADGVVGPKTLAALNGYTDQRGLFQKIQDDRIAYYIGIAVGAKAKYRKGWVNRAKRITWNGFVYA